MPVRMENDGVDSKTPKPLDGGWGWVVTIGVGLSFGISFGFAKAFTLIHRSIAWRYQTTELETALVFTCYTGIIYFASPIASFLLKFLSFRQAMLIAGICTSTGAVLSAFSLSVPVVCMSLGIITGMGFSLMDVTNYSIIGQYFDKKKGTAFAVSTMFIDIGGIAFPPIISLILYQYGLPGTMLIIGGVFMNLVVSGALFRPLQANYPKHKYQPSGQNKDGVACNETLEEINSGGSRYNDTQLTDLPDEPFYLGQAKIVTQTTPKIKTKNGGHLKGKCLPCVKKSGLHLLTNFSFVIFAIQMTGLAFVMVTKGLYFAGFAKEKHLMEKEIVGMLMGFSSLDIVTRLLSGYIFDKPLIRKYIVPVHSLVGVAQCIFLYSLVFSHSRVLCYIFWALIEMMAATVHCQHVHVLSHLVGEKNVPNAFGLMRFFQGFCVMFGASIGGYIFDATGSYKLSYTVAASVGIVSAGSVLFFYSLGFVKLKQK